MAPHWDKVLCLVALVKDETAIKRLSTTPFHQLVQSAGVATFERPGRQTHTTLWYSGRHSVVLRLLPYAKSYTVDGLHWSRVIISALHYSKLLELGVLASLNAADKSGVC